jgi:hypothetical protein
LLYWYKSTRFTSTTPRGAQLLALQASKAREFCFHFFFKTEKRAASASSRCKPSLSARPGTQFTCFTGTKVQILTAVFVLLYRAGDSLAAMLAQTEVTENALITAKRCAEDAEQALVA